MEVQVGNVQPSDSCFPEVGERTQVLPAAAAAATQMCVHFRPLQAGAGLESGLGTSLPLTGVR